MQTTQEYAQQLRQAHASGSMMARQAAEAAHQMRNEIMEMARVHSMEMGQAVVIEFRTYLSISMGPSSQLPGAFGSALR